MARFTPFGTMLQALRNRFCYSDRLQCYVRMGYIQKGDDPKNDLVRIEFCPPESLSAYLRSTHLRGRGCKKNELEFIIWKDPVSESLISLLKLPKRHFTECEVHIVNANGEIVQSSIRPQPDFI